MQKNNKNMATRSASRKSRARRALDPRNAVWFNGELMIEIMEWCNFRDLRRTTMVCSAVNKLDFTWLINREAERRFKLTFPYAHWLASNHSNPTISKEKYWIIVFGTFRKDMKSLPTLTFTKNTRLAVAQRSLQVRRNRMFFLIGKRLQLKVLFKNGFLQVIGMHDVVLDELNRCKYKHNLAQCSDLQSLAVYVTHIDRRPLNSFNGIKDVGLFLCVKKLVSISLLIKPKNQWPLECRVPWNTDWEGFDNHILIL